MKTNLKNSLIKLAFLMVLLTPALGWSQASVDLFLPAIDSSPYLTVYGSQTLQQWQYKTGLYLNYAKNPLEVGIGGIRRQGIVDHLLVGDFYGSIGLADWAQIGADVPVAFFEEFNNLANGVTEQVLTTMDIRLESKFRLLDIDRHHFGIAILPYITFPTGDEGRLVGNHGITGGAKLVADYNIKDRVQVSANVGYVARQGVVILNTEQDDMLTYGLGVSIAAVKRKLDIIFESYGNANATNLFSREEETPVEIDGGVRYHFSKPEGLQLTAGGGAGLTFGYGAPDFRALVGLAYEKPGRVELPPPPPPPQEEVLAKVTEDKIDTKKIHFEFDKAVIRPISFRILDAVVDILKANPKIKKVRIEGHTDSKGTDAYNMKLSQRRANAVRDYLMGHGISGDRLVAVGYGESRPVADNGTPEGRARNRRVEFAIIEQESGAPTSSTPASKPKP